MATRFSGFSPKLTTFLKSLERNNDKAWFQKNKATFDEHVQGAMLDFIAAIGPRLEKISPHIVADPSKVGGSLTRIYRDTRFSKDKRPYHTYVAARFKHGGAPKDAAPGFYLGVDGKAVVLGAGCWHPEPKALTKIRDHIVTDPKAWVRIRDGKKFRETFPDLEGESLKRPPKGYPPEHPLVEDLKRKDIVAFCKWKPSALTDKDFLKNTVAAYRTSSRFVAFLCDALGLPY